MWYSDVYLHDTYPEVRLLDQKYLIWIFDTILNVALPRVCTPTNDIWWQLFTPDLPKEFDVKLSDSLIWCHFNCIYHMIGKFKQVLIFFFFRAYLYLFICFRLVWRRVLFHDFLLIFLLGCWDFSWLFIDISLYIREFNPLCRGCQYIFTVSFVFHFVYDALQHAITTSQWMVLYLEHFLDMRHICKVNFQQWNCRVRMYICL